MKQALGGRRGGPLHHAGRQAGTWVTLSWLHISGLRGAGLGLAECALECCGQGKTAGPHSASARHPRVGFRGTKGPTKVGRVAPQGEPSQGWQQQQGTQEAWAGWAQGHETRPLCRGEGPPFIPVDSC